MYFAKDLLLVCFIVHGGFCHSSEESHSGESHSSEESHSGESHSSEESHSGESHHGCHHHHSGESRSHESHSEESHVHGAFCHRGTAQPPEVSDYVSVISKLKNAFLYMCAIEL